MAQPRRLCGSGVSPAVAGQVRRRSKLSVENIDQLSVAQSDDRLDDSAVAESESVKCSSQEDGAKNELQCGKSKQLVSDTSALSTKRKHKPNTMYATDFVFSSTKKSKVKRLESESVLPAGNLKKVSSDSGRDNICLERAEVTEIAYEVPAVSVNRQEEKTHCSNSAVTEIKSSGSLPSILNLSPKSADLKLSKKAIVKRDRRHISLPKELLQTSSVLSDETEMPLTVPRKRGRPQKKQASEVKHDDKCTSAEHENSNSGTLLSDSNFTLTDASLGAKASAGKGMMAESVTSPDVHLTTETGSHSAYSEMPLKVPRKRGRPRKMLLDNHPPKPVENCGECSLTTNESANSENSLSGQNTCRKDKFLPLIAKSSVIKGMASDLTNTTLSDEWLGTSLDSPITNTVPSSVLRKRGRPPKKFRERNLTKTCKEDASAEGTVRVVFIDIFTYFLHIFHC